jgi:hypothetical protein
MRNLTDLMRDRDVTKLEDLELLKCKQEALQQELEDELLNMWQTACIDEDPCWKAQNRIGLLNH